MNRRYWIAAIAVLILLSSNSVLAFMPPSIDIYCHTNMTFLNYNSIPANSTYYYNVTKYGANYTTGLVTMKTEDYGILSFIDFSYNDAVLNESSFSALSNFCEEDVTPILTMIRQNKISTSRGGCEVRPYSRSVEDAFIWWRSEERIGDWSVSCLNGSTSIVLTILLLVLLCLVRLAPLALLVVVVLAIIKLREFYKSKKNTRKRSS
jgi:hypothetical protein